MKKLLLITLAACLLLPAPAFASSLNSQLRKAQKQIKNNKLEDGLKTLLDAQIDTPEDPLLDYHLGQVYYKMERYPEAAAAWQKALRTDDKNLRADAVYALGNNAFKQGQLKEAIEFFSQVVDMRPDDEDAKYNLDLAREELRRLLEEQKKQQEKQEQQQQEQQENQQCNNPQPGDGNSDGQQAEQPDSGNEASSDEGGREPQQNEASGEEPKEAEEQPQTGAGQEQEEQEAPDSDEQNDGQENSAGSDQEAEEQQNQPAGESELRPGEEEPESDEAVSQREAEQALRRLQEQPPVPKMVGKGRRRVTKDW